MVKMVKLMNTELTPEGWESKAIGDISNIHRGMSWNADNVADRPDMGIPVLRIPNVQNKLSLDDLKYLSDISEEDKVRYRVSQGYSIMVGSNGNKDRVGNCCYIEQDMEFVFASFLLACSAKEGNDNKYLFYLLTSYPIQGAISSDAATSTGLHNIGLKFIRRREVLIPPLPEQRKIAEILSTVDEAIEKTDAIIQETQQLKKGLLQKLFTEGIGHTRLKQTKIGQIPEEWDYEILGSVAKVKGGKRLPKGDQFAGTRTPYPYIRIVDFRNMSVAMGELKYLNEKTQKSIARYTISSSDVYISIAGTIGLVGIVPDELDGANLTENAAKICNLKKVNKVFLAYFLISPNAQKQIDSFIGISTQPKLALNRIEKIQLPIPDLDEQCKIAEILSEDDAKIEKEQAFKAELEQLKKGLMQVLLTGKVRVKV